MRWKSGLAYQRYLFGAQPVETDWRFFVTLVRFDPVYYGHFKCNLRRIVDYPNLYGYLRDLYQIDGVAETVELRSHQAPLLRHARRHQPDPDRSNRAAHGPHEPAQPRAPLPASP